MDSQEESPASNGNLKKSCVIEWDELFTDQELQAIDAIEAAFLSTSTGSSIVKKRRHHFTPQNDHHLHNKSRRQLPTSFLDPLRSFSLSPCQANLKVRYPAIKFKGRIFYSRTQTEVENAARELLRSLDARRRELGQVVLGFDIEWKPTFRTGVLPGKVAVMQICADAGDCHVMHIIHSGITSTLQHLLKDPTLLKVGVGIGNDCVKVYKDYDVSIKAVEDLSSLANRKLGESKNWSLQSLTEMLVCKELLKPSKIRLGNWEVDVLSTEQLHYAATDAFTSWHLYQVLKSLPDAKVASEKAPQEQGNVPQSSAIHEYMRQLLNISGIVYRYQKMKEMTATEREAKFVPRVMYIRWKSIRYICTVKFITDVGALVNHDPEIDDLLKVVFVPDYNVSVAELLIPARSFYLDGSESQVTLAGMEASGTSYMKFAINGCVLLGTLDGANVEIQQEFVPDPCFEEVKKFIRSGALGSYNYDELIGSLEGNEGFGRAEYFLVGKDFLSYIECQEEVDKAYRNEKRWTKLSIMNTAGSHKFSSDRTMNMLET